MMDVFAAAGDPDGHGQRPSSDDRAELTAGPPIDPAALEPILEGAALWGMELDTRYRVLALTVEPAPGREPLHDPVDRRLQLLAFPVSTILVSLRSDGSRTIHTFDADQLVDVVAALGGARLPASVLSGAEPRPGEWGPSYSLQGRSSAPDGTAATLRFTVATDDLELRVFARYDQLRLRDAEGRELGPPR